MKGDKHKPKPTFYRWVDAFCDGACAPKKTHYRVPSQTDGKKYNRRWRRHSEKMDLLKLFKRYY